ncbi:hypothetical protein [Burkholderia cenocepacia]|uniref:hypothetical protein n=1 Tax=Burkholderia cenocepacia TaxID=95486 RepID=UPI001F4AC3AD|nr:hypothetical protein [Burkholderia cenocepacia]
MKATILSDGTLSVSPESELDAYALGQWSRQNIGDWFNAAARPMAIIIDCSAYPRALEPLTIPQARPGQRV